MRLISCGIIWIEGNYYIEYLTQSHEIQFILGWWCSGVLSTYNSYCIVHIIHSVWKPRTYKRAFWHCSYSSLSVETSYIHTCFLALFIFITKCGNLVHTYVFSGIVRIHHSVRKICIWYNILFYGNRYSFLL